ncbi:MAG: PEP/pyruvate-binding domain-containing protein [Chloroflexi bacterium]|nr:PEP/pyruvate-binding domain-containing protein [Chloroflexota bacterium]
MPESSNILSIHLLIAQYPILARKIRHRMREELYRRGVITAARLEREVHEKAVLSQQREGITNPMAQEDAHQWEQRLQLTRDHLTDFYFAHNLPLDLFHQIVEGLVTQRNGRTTEDVLAFNPELAPLDLLLKQAEQYEALPPEQRATVAHHLEEIKVVLIKTLIVDQLEFVRIAKHWFTAADFKEIRANCIGSGKIGGKAGGMWLAWKILQGAPPTIAQQVRVPRSYYVGANVSYDFLALNGLEFLDQKYKPLEQTRAEWPQVQAAYVRSRFPEEIADRLRDILKETGKTPLIVRSSSRLEDNFGASFAGKYASFFCPNQGTLKENLRDLTLAIRRTYASVVNPDALAYRRRMGLLDYDERMAILLQEVQGETYHHYFFPALAGVAYSRSPIVWNRRLRREEGFVRLVAGLGTRAVERVADDYPRLIMLSHPSLRPEISTEDIRHYSQHQMDLIDLASNALVTLPVRRVLDRDYPHLAWLCSVDHGDTILPLFARGPELAADRLVLTFDNLLQRSHAAALLKGVLSTLEREYQVPVDVEFVIGIQAQSPAPRLTFHLLQCRPQAHRMGERVRDMPGDLAPEDELFRATRMVPQGHVGQIEYIVFVDPACYRGTAHAAHRTLIARIVGMLNKHLEGHSFILMGPGRWGSNNSDLGVPVSYGDIYNARLIVELAVTQQGITPEPSYGTHFFQDLVEAQIYPLALYPDKPADFLNAAFLQAANNYLANLLPEFAPYGHCVKVIHVPAECNGRHLDVVMDGEKALAYFGN